MTSDIVKKILVMIILIMISQFLIRLINIKRLKRGRQILVSILTPLVMLITVAIAYYKYDTYVISPLNDFFDGMVIVWNLIMVAVFFTFKIVFCPIVNAIWSIQTVMAVTGDACYIYNDDVNIWFLKTSYTNMRKTANVLAWVTAGLSGLILSLDWILGVDSDWYLKVFPFAAMIIATEFYNYLNGITQPEFERNVKGEEITSRTKGAYYKLRRVYEKMYPTPLLVSHTGNESMGKEGSSNMLERMTKDGDTIQQEVGDYFLHLDRKEGSFDTDLIKVTEDLRRGKSAVIFTPFYRDLSDYLLLPLVVTTLFDKKCLVVSGRDNSKEDVKKWLNEIFYNYGKTKKLWRVEGLDSYEKECEIGVISFSQIYDIRVMKANKNFFNEIGFILMIEPSRMLSTGQIGLNILAEYANRECKATLCALDRDVDGLVDTLSHVFKTEITTVLAPPLSRSVYTVMGWDARGDYKRQKMFNKETRYLGNGVELAAVAIKNQINHVEWYSSEKAPVEDIKWIAGQYYPAITKYSNLTAQQHSLEDALSYETNLWGGVEKNEAFVIAEDEFCNIFEALRMYLSRGTLQSFVNVISENYLLRDYMRYNRQLFMTDAKAIPSICSSYSKTERNTIIKLILLMATNPIDESVIKYELSLLDINTDDIYSALIELIYKYTNITETLITVRNRQMPGDDLLPERKREFFITPDTFSRNFARTIKNAYYIVEDEEAESEIVDAKLFGHITQLVMPNQILVHNGKAYRVHKCTPELGCILHRASDSYMDRLYYRQLRRYNLEQKVETIFSRTVHDIGIDFESWCFSVKTTGYLEMYDNDDLRDAKLVDLSDDPSISNYDRSYKNKEVLKINLPDTTKDIRYTFAVLLSELFRTLFHENWPYLAVLAEIDEDKDGMLHKFNYIVEGELDENAIYIVEDSEIDLGLLEAISNNIVRIFEILEDYLQWHFAKIKEPPMKDPVLDRIEVDEEDLKVKETFKQKFLKRFKKLFGFRDEELENSEEEQEVIDEEESATPANEVPKKVNAVYREKESLSDENEGEKNQTQKTEVKETEKELGEGFDVYSREADPENEKIWKTYDNKKTDMSDKKVKVDFHIDDSEKIVVIGGEKISTLEVLPNELEMAIYIEPSRYHQECYLNFGFQEIDHKMKLDLVKTYLTARGFGDNSLAKARRRKKFDDNILDFNAENYCDFCERPLSGVSYDVLADGRVRCNDCTTTAIRDVREFNEIYQRAEMMMENIFNIKYPVAININTADARVLAQHLHAVYTPSRQVSVRALGFAQYKSGEYSIFLENGCPRLVALYILTHEMTHIWQYINWNREQIKKIYKQDSKIRDAVAMDLVYEGMAIWASIQILYSMGETYFAEQKEQEMLIFKSVDKDDVEVRRKDEYGYGYYLYRKRYGIESSGDVPPYSPFKFFPTLDPGEVRDIVLILCPDE